MLSNSDLSQGATMGAKIYDDQLDDNSWLEIQRIAIDLDRLITEKERFELCRKYYLIMKNILN